MRRLIVVIALCLLTVPVFCQPTSKWQIAIITDVKPRQGPEDAASGAASYDVSVKVGNTMYVVLYTQPSSELPAKYATGRELLVLVGKNTITYNDVLGRSLQVPIVSQRPATDSKRGK